jgi:hypothetical protein
MKNQGIKSVTRDPTSN